MSMRDMKGDRSPTALAAPQGRVRRRSQTYTDLLFAEEGGVAKLAQFLIEDVTEWFGAVMPKGIFLP